MTTISELSQGVDSVIDNKKPVVIGIYGLPGAGKSYLLGNLKEILREEQFLFMDSSDVLHHVTTGGLKAFKLLEDTDKIKHREIAVRHIAAQAKAANKAAVVTGHLMFWSESEDSGTKVATPADAQVYTHILYFDLSTYKLMNRRKNDNIRVRPDVSADHLAKWQQAEKDELRRLCYDNGILFPFWIWRVPQLLVSPIYSSTLSSTMRNIIWLKSCHPCSRS